MKKILFKIKKLLLAISALPAVAATKIEVESMSNFSTLNPSKTMKVVAHEKVEFENGIIFENGTIITGNIIDVKQPTRGKRNASFKFLATSYTYNGKTTKILDDEFIGKYIEKKEIDKGNAAISAASTAGGLILGVPGFSQGISMVKGMVKNTEENRLKSGIKQVYKDSPLSYVEEGKDVVIKTGDIFYLKFKTNETEDLEEDSIPDEQTTSTQQALQDTKEVSDTSTQIGEVMSKPANLKFPHPDEVLQEVQLNTKWENFVNFFIRKFCNNFFAFKYSNIC